MKLLGELEKKVHHCEACPRLRNYCAQVASEKRKSFRDQTYWGRPVSGFGDPQAQLVLVGLAPAAHGANRTGRIFTGDQSGLWLYRALFRAGFANQPESVSREDGLVLKNAYVSCVVKCAPPGNKPSPEEQKECVRLFLGPEKQALVQARVWVALGQIAFQNLWSLFEIMGPKPKFKHGEVVDLGSGRSLILSFHPSQQNTFTGKLTEPMFDSIFEMAKKLLKKNSKTFS